MENKICNKCGQEKHVDEFYKKNEGKQAWCKKCVLSAQKIRWRDRKRKAVDLLGGKCQICGYCRNFSSLVFHHLIPQEKEFSWFKMRLRSWDKVVKELKKCVLLCQNCHGEIHWPQHNIVDKKTLTDNNLLNRIISLTMSPTMSPTGKCPICDEDVYGTIYCSVKCSSISRRKVKRPSKKNLKKMLDNMSFCAIGRQYQVSDNAVRKWAKTYGLL
jgi:hypothetical protein